MQLEKIKRLLQKVLLMVLTALMAFPTVEVHAEELNVEIWNDIWYYNYATNKRFEFSKGTINGVPVYCIQPLVEVGYGVTPGYETGLLDDYNSIPLETRQEIALYSYFGYGKLDNEKITLCATQELIWNALGYKCSYGTWAENIGDLDDAVHAKMEQIKASIDLSPYTKVSNWVPQNGRNTKSGEQAYAEGNVGETLTFIDENNVVGEILSDGGLNVTKEGNKISIVLDKSSINQEKTISFNTNAELIPPRPIVYANPDTQDVMTAGLMVDPGHSTITVKTSGIPVEEEKVTDSGEKVVGAHLQLIQNGKVIDEWDTTDKNHSNILIPGNTYTLKETNLPDGYYFADDVTFTVGDQPQTIKLVDSEIKYEVQKLDDKGSPVKSAVLELYDVTDNNKLIKTWNTSDKAESIGKILHAGHKYRIHEKVAAKAHYFAEDYEFEVPLKGKPDMQTIKLVDNNINWEVLKLDDRGYPVKDAKLQLWDETDGDKLIYEWSSTDKAKNISKYLEAGHSYKIVETDVSLHYYLAVAVKFTVPRYGTPDMVTTKVINNYIQYELRKTDDEGNLIKDAVLQIFDMDDHERLILEWKSSDTEPLTINHFERGHTYKAVETSVPDGFYFADEVTFTIDENGTSDSISIGIVDNKINYQIAKVDENGNPVKGAELKLYDVTEKKQLLDEWTTTEEPRKMLLPIVEHKYRIEETKTPDGFYTAEAKEFMIPKKGTSEMVTISVVNERINYEVLKVDEKGNPVPGVKIELFHGEEKLDEWITDGKPKEIGHLLRLGETYKLVETEAVAGFYKSVDKEFTVSETKPKENKVTVTMEDESFQYFVVKKDDSGKELEGAKITLTDKETGEMLDEWTTVLEPYEITNHVVPGKTYILKESEYVKGYYIAVDKEFTVDEYPNDKNKVVTLEMIDDKINYQIKKVDEEGEIVPGVKLELYDITNKKEDNLVGEWITTDEPILLEDLEPGHSYKLVESEYVAGKYKATDIEFTVPENGTSEMVTITMVDIDIDISFLKTRMDGTPLAGAKLQIVDKDMNVLYNLVSTDSDKGVNTDINGKKIELMPGEKYILKEKEAPFGYEKAKDITFEIPLEETDPDKVIEIKMADEAKHFFVSVIKVDAMDQSKKLKDCELTVFDKKTNQIAKTVDGKDAIGITDGEGNIVFELAYSENGYYVKETKAPLGYRMNKNHFDVELSEDYNFAKDNPIVIVVNDQAAPVKTGVDGPIIYVGLSIGSLFGLLGILIYKKMQAKVKKQGTGN